MFSTPRLKDTNAHVYLGVRCVQICFCNSVKLIFPLIIMCLETMLTASAQIKLYLITDESMTIYKRSI